MSAPDVVCGLLANSAVAAGLGLCAWLVWRVWRNAPVAHGLAALALLKLVTPPLLAVDVGPWWPQAASSAAVGATPEDWLLVPATSPPPAPGPAAVAPARLSAVDLASWGVGVWLAGAALAAVVAWRRARRCAALLRRAETAPEAVNALVPPLAARLGLRRVPAVCVVDANLSPFLWAMGGQPVIVVPRAMLASLSPRDLRSVLAHELAHLANRDHWTRWLEVVVAALHWWNPVAHAVRQLLREVEEVRCDARAVEALATRPHGYGRALLRVATQLDVGSMAPPLGASGFGGPRALNRRLTMIAQSKLSHRLSWPARALLVSGAIAVLPLGVEAQEKGGDTGEKKEQREVRVRVGGDLDEKIRKAVAEALEKHLHGGGDHGSGHGEHGGEHGHGHGEHEHGGEVHRYSFGGEGGVTVRSKKGESPRVFFNREGKSWSFAEGDDGEVQVTPFGKSGVSWLRVTNDDDADDGDGAECDDSGARAFFRMSEGDGEGKGGAVRFFRSGDGEHSANGKGVRVHTLRRAKAGDAGSWGVGVGSGAGGKGVFRVLKAGEGVSVDGDGFRGRVLQFSGDGEDAPKGRFSYRIRTGAGGNDEGDDGDDDRDALRQRIEELEKELRALKGKLKKRLL